MNRQEWLDGGKKSNFQRRYVSKLLREWKLSNGITGKCVIHHRDDTDETRDYNSKHYELWGFNEDGTFEYGKYVLFMTQSEHSRHHAKGGARSEEYRSKISKSLMGRFTGENHPFYGKHHTEEARQRMSKSHTGKILSEEHIRKISESNKGTVRTDIHRDHYRSARQKFSVLYAKYKENGGTLKWNDFCHAVKKGDAEITTTITGEKSPLAKGDKDGKA